jgi:hypothetical protein
MSKTEHTISRIQRFCEERIANVRGAESCMSEIEDNRMVTTLARITNCPRRSLVSKALDPVDELASPAASGRDRLVVIHKNNAKAAAAKRALAAVKPSVTATVATATKGSIGIYLDAIGTVTPVYTASITAQASGVLTAVHYSEGQFVQKGDALIDIDPRPYQAQLLQAEGALERDTNVLAQAQMDLDRYRTAWAGNGIPSNCWMTRKKLCCRTRAR